MTSVRIAALVVGLVAVIPLHAEEALFSSAYWPKSVPLKLAPAPEKQPFTDFLKTDLRGADPYPHGVGRPKGKAGQPRAVAVGKPEDAPATAARKKQLAEETRAVDRELSELTRRSIELTNSAGDLVQLAVSDSRKKLLRPLLLFLVEAGVLAAAEVDRWMAAEDVQPLLDRVKEALDRLEDKKDALQVRRYLLDEKK